jgi:CHASE2 domain-containing sensor protein
LAQAKPADRNGTFSVVFAASVLLIGPVGAVLAIVFAVRSRRTLGYLSLTAWIGLIVGSLVLLLFGLFALLIVWLEHSSLTY